MVMDTVSGYGIYFTSSTFVETKLLKMLNDAHAPHFLYQDVLNWTKEGAAKELNYDFLPCCYTLYMLDINQTY
jgi:hypothetical protein